MAKEVAPRPLARQVWFRLFGSVTVYDDGQSLDLGTKRERRLLVALLVAQGRRIPRGTLAEWVWDDVPDRYVQGLYEVVGDVRKRLAPVGLGEKLMCKDGWYSFHVAPEWVDVHQFREMVTRALALEGEPRRDMLANALKLCGGGEPMAGLDGSEIEALRARLHGQIRDVEIMISQTDLRNGRYERPISDLDRLFRVAPDDMRVAGLFMYALHGVGRTVDALAVYPRHREAHIEATGISVGQPLQDLHRSILEDQSDLSPAAEVFLGGRPTPSDTSEEPEETAGGQQPRTEPVDTGTGATAPIHAVTETVFNAPVNASGRVVFGIDIGGMS